MVCVGLFVCIGFELCLVGEVRAEGDSLPAIDVGDELLDFRVGAAHCVELRSRCIGGWSGVTGSIMAMAAMDGSPSCFPAIF
jgi:hypothetical protein